ncbi:MAG: aminomethyl-transferring glycine dehydrogenase subunit GcvPB [Tissierellia bacterium]|nr:aminomethyl-transferring glycine dehydrogenase subunit GcvPB [Tissierellia bacterium]
MSHYNTLIFEKSTPGQIGYSLPKLDVPEVDLSNLGELRQDLDLPEVSENEIMRHYLNLSLLNHSVDTGFYPLGSCTMKYNPKINEDIAKMPSLAYLHPKQPLETIQGSLELMYGLQEQLKIIAGMDAFTLQPAAGAQGELTGLMIIKAFHEKNGDVHKNEIIVPDSAHGTNPATVAMVGYNLIEIKSQADGGVDLEALKAAVNENTAGLMLTNPSTLGLFEQQIEEIARIIHDVGGQLYYDGANMNAIMGKARPGDMGFDVMHYNVHKTFSTPHGGGGPGGGPVGVKAHLAEFLPVPVVDKSDDGYFFNYDRPHSIGKVKAYYGNYGILVRAYTYIKSLGGPGLELASDMAVLNANYMMKRLKKTYALPFDQVCKHEFVLSGIKDHPEISTLDIAKRMLDFGVHPPTIYFPLIVHGAIMVEPTETESKATLDQFADIMEQIAREGIEDPETLKQAPHTTKVGRVDEVYAAKALILKYGDMTDDQIRRD